ncbi:obscurin-like isoform X2 [Triplophysa dalaica]|uniref:obscurin-like isoform X2 n=1 Tax=Triplophysa dalaica TaxID=1582913 RepID=UPI0024DF6E92|nr:obscurin-like isoform X2 [Triplophysa dalaica]
MEMFQIIFLAVAVGAQVSPPTVNTGKTNIAPIQIPKPQIVQKPFYKVLYNTENVNLECVVNGAIADLQYEWYKDSTSLKPPLDQAVIIVSTGGEYQCKAKKGVTESEKSDSETLKIQAIPTAKLTLESALSVFYPSEKVTLKCEIEGSSDDWSYNWYKNMGDLQGHKSSLEINLTSKEDSGEYTCQGFIKERVTTEMSSAVKLQVNAIPTAKLTLEPAVAVFYPSEKVTLKCEIEGSSDNWSYKWFRNKGELKESKPSLEIQSTSKDDSGEYTCQRFIKERVTTEMSSSVTLQVNAIPTAKLTLEPALAVFYPSEKVTLKCEIEGSSDNWSYKWFRNKGELKESKPSLEIQSTSKDDSGEYTCQRFIKERVTTEMSSAVTLQVNETPRPKLTADPNWTEFFPNETITLTCGFDGNSDGWSFEWLKMNEKIKTSSTLTITAKPSDSGQYSCKGKLRSVVTQQSDAFPLRVHDKWPKPNLTQSQNFQVFYEGEAITFNCGVDVQFSNWEYQFFRDLVPIHDFTSNSFSIKSVQVSDSGKYSCQVKRRTLSSGQSDVRTVTVKEISKAQLSSEWKDAFPGETVSLQCVIPGVSENWIYMWFRNDKTVSSGPDTNIYENTLSLSVKSHPAGLYMYVCQAQLERRSVKTAKSTQHSLHIYGSKPTFIVGQDPQYPEIYTGEQVKLKCSIQEQTSNWAYQWKKDKSEHDIQGETYTIQSATLSHNGSYTCHISRNKVTFSSEPKLITIIEPPQPKLSIESEWKMFYPTEKITLKCSINKNPLDWRYEWYRNMTKLSEDKDTLLIQSANRSHSGGYKCKAEHRQRSPVTTIETVASQIQIFDKTPKPDLRIHPPNITLFYAGERIRLDCKMPGAGWEYHWSKDSKPTQPSIKNINYIINSASLHHTGNYTCEAKRGDFSISSEPLKLEVQDKTPKPDLRIHPPNITFFYTDERIHLDCKMPGAGWEYHWSKDSKPTQPSIKNINYTINSASLHHTGDYICEAKRGDFSISSEPLKLEVQARLPAVLTLSTELSDIMAGNTLTLRCEVSDGKVWNYTWSENGQELNESSNTLEVESTEDTIKNEFKCRGKRTVRPLYSSWSEGFVANNIVFKRKIVQAISGFFVCCILILISGCIILKITRKPVRNETVREDLFISMADSKNQATTPLMEYMENKPTENDSEEKEELNMDHISITHVDGVIKGEDSPSAESNGLTSFKGS